MEVRSPRTPHERIEAIRCLSGSDRDRQDFGHTTATIDDLPSIEADGLVAVWSNGRPLAAVLCCFSPEGTAFLWPPEVAPEASAADTLMSVLLDAVTERIDAAGCRMTLSTVPLHRKDHHRALMNAGFQRASEVWTFQHALDRKSRSAPKSDARRVSFHPDEEARFERVIERTLADCVDCRSWNVRLTARDLLNSYRGSGNDATKHWSLIAIDGDDLAVALVHDRPEDRGREIAYLGVVPEARRRGIAREIVASILAEAIADGCDNVITTADAGNAPAVALYRQLGFLAIDRRAGYVRVRKAGVETGDRAGGSDLH